MENKSFQEKLSPAQILVALDSQTSDKMEGRLYSGYFHKVYTFKSDIDLIMAIDNLCNSMQFPQAACQSRRFEFKYTKTLVRKAEDFMDSEIEAAAKQDNATFLVHIKFRQNASWQGSITWVEKEKTQNFRSALEMLKLMDEARHSSVKETIDWEGIS